MSYILITGASSGIGKEFANNFAKKGFDLLLVASNMERLLMTKKELDVKYSNINILTLALDLSLEEGAKSVYDYVINNNLDIFCLINNAGIGDFGFFLDGDLKKYQRMINLNDRSLISLAYYFGNYFKKRQKGHIVNIASIAGFMPGPYMNVYYASKAFVLNFSLALKEELKPYHIKVTTICPGPIDTNFWQVANVKMSPFKKKYFTRNVSKLVNSSMYDIEKGKLYVDGLIYKIVAVVTGFIPKSFLTTIVKKVNLKLGKKGE